MANGNPFYVAPLGGLQGVQQIQQGMGAIANVAQQERAQQQQQQAQQAVAQAFESGDVNAIRQAMIQYPEMAEQAKNAFGFTNEQSERVARETYRRVLSDPGNAAQYMQQGIEQVAALGGRPEMMTRDLQMLQQAPEEALKNIRAGYAALATEPEYEAMFGAGGVSTAATRAFEARAAAAGLEPGSPEYQRAAMVELGLVPRAGISASERIALSPELTAQVAASEAAQTGASERAKLQERLELEPQVRGAIKVAESEAQSRGESLSELNRARAALPGIREVVNRLASLADVATYTAAGQAFNEAAKQLGFGATEGATARAQMIATVDNQVLPLLRDTFGAAFTEAEGQRLRDTLLDPDAPPATKRAQLNAFLDQKIRDIETKEAAAGETSAGGDVTDWSDL